MPCSDTLMADKYDEKAREIHREWWAWEGTIHENLPPMIAKALRDLAAAKDQEAHELKSGWEAQARQLERLLGVAMRALNELSSTQHHNSVPALEIARTALEEIRKER